MIGGAIIRKAFPIIKSIAIIKETTSLSIESFVAK